MLTPVIRRTYAPRGKTPIQQAWDRRDRISAISAITISPKRRQLNLYFRLLPDNENVHAEDVVEFLRDLRRHIGPLMTIVWDRSNTHDRSRAVQAFLRNNPTIRTERFPGYAPELNPDEGVWSYTKFARLANFAPTDTRHMRRRIYYELNRLKRRPDLLASFIEHTELPINL